MNRWLSVALCPPCAVVDCGCAGGCGAPIGVLYAAGVFAIVYGLFFGGPLGVAGISYGTVGLGLVLWTVSAVWAALALARYGERCAARSAPSPRASRDDDTFAEAEKAKSP